MRINRISAIDWLNAMSKLSIGAFFLLNVLYRKDIDINDSAMMMSTGFGESTHRKHKKELIEHDYLIIEQVGRGVYKYTLKDTDVKEIN